MIDISDQDAISCSLIYRTNGLSDALHFILGLLPEDLEVKRINILCASCDLKIFLPLADTMEIDYGVIRGLKSKDAPALLPDKIEQPCVVSDLEMYRGWLEKTIPNANVPLYHYRSMLRIPLFTTPAYNFTIHLFSSLKNAFNETDVEPLQMLLSHLTEDLRENFSGSFIIPEKADETGHFALLRRQSGLIPLTKDIMNVAPTMTTVAIFGETGTGKEIVADAIHETSKRSAKPLVKVNCGAIPETLMESELFGHERGSFTGAQTTRSGYFEMAKGGTLFLDEIGELPLASQAKLLRVLDSGVYYRVGNARPLRADVRIIVATNRNLAKMVTEGTFRQDLFYRVCTYPLHIPPLRDRPEDIIDLAKHFIQKKMTDFGIYGLPIISEAECAKLKTHMWPGNVRELEFVVERALIDARMGAKGDLSFKLTDSANLCNFLDQDWPTLEELKKRYISKVLEKTSGRLSGKHGAAAILGIHYTTLITWLKNYKNK